MRIVSGSARGKKLIVVPGEGTRPILDRVKTSLLDILRPRISGCKVLDLFAGSGSVGIETLSQGAAHCTFTELGHKAIATIKKNLATSGFSDRAEVRQTDAFEYLRKTSESFDLIYVAPPQYKNLWVQAMQQIAQTPRTAAGNRPPNRTKTSRPAWRSCKSTRRSTSTSTWARSARRGRSATATLSWSSSNSTRTGYVNSHTSLSRSDWPRCCHPPAFFGPLATPADDGFTTDAVYVAPRQGADLKSRHPPIMLDQEMRKAQGSPKWTPSTGQLSAATGFLRHHEQGLTRWARAGDRSSPLSTTTTHRRSVGHPRSTGGARSGRVDGPSGRGPVVPGRLSELGDMVRAAGPGADRAAASSLVPLWRDHPGDPGRVATLRIIERGAFHRTFFPMPSPRSFTAPAAGTGVRLARQWRGPAGVCDLGDHAHPLLTRSRGVAPIPRHGSVRMVRRTGVYLARVAQMVIEVTGDTRISSRPAGPGAGG